MGVDHDLLADLDHVARLGPELIPGAECRPPCVPHGLQPTGTAGLGPVDHLELDLGVVELPAAEVAARPLVIDAPHQVDVLP
jgi:hypothetical protein